MKSRFFTSILIVALLIVAVVLPAMSTGCTSEGDTLKIGVMTPATGVAAEKGSAGRAGALDCIKYINDEGGVNGYKIEAVSRDSSYSADKVPGISSFQYIREEYRPGFFALSLLFPRCSLPCQLFRIGYHS